MTDRALRVRFSALVMDAPECEGEPPEGVITALVSSYNRPYEVAPGVREQIAPGAFQMGRHAAYGQHGHLRGAAPIGHVDFTDVPGVGIRAEYTLYLEDSADARLYYRAAKNGVPLEHSIGFYPDEVKFDQRTGLETVVRGDLAESSIVLRGANPDNATLSVRQAPAVAPVAPGYAGSLESPVIRRLLAEQSAATKGTE